MSTHANPTLTPALACPSQAELVETRPPGTLRRHPRAVLIPEVSREGFAALRDDIARRGLQVPLEITDKAVILDGHLRLRACLELGLESVSVRVVAPPDEVEYMLLAAIERRQLSPSQRATLAVELAQYTQMRQAARRRRLANLKGQTAEVATLPPRGKTRELAAAWAGVSARTIQDAATVHAADTVLFEQVKQGRLPVAQAARQIIQRQRDAEIPPSPALPAGLFDLIYADPAWRLPGRPDSSRAVENHYPTLPLAEIKAIQVPAADDAILYLWAVNSMLPEALAVLDAWGFSYETNDAWIKNKWGLGSWNRTQHELLLIGVRGSFRAPPPSRRLSSVIHAPRGRHSQKPTKVYERLEHMYPQARKLELFARGPARPGWTFWGNQAEPPEPTQ